MTHTTLITSLLGLALVACGDNARSLSSASPLGGPPWALIVAGDFAPGHPGILTAFDPDTGAVRSNAGPAMAVGNDPILRHIGDELLIINRGENNVTILDDKTLRFKAQIGAGEGSNPQDVAVVANKLYIATFLGRGLTVRTRGSTATTVIDLSADDPDGEPNCNSIYLVGGLLYVSCERFDPRFTPRGPGKVYVVDPETDTVRTDLTVTLGHENPFGLFEQIPDGAPHAGDLVISTVGDFTPAAGCVERIATGRAPAAAGCMLENTMVGGYATRIAFEVESGLAMMWTAVAVPQESTPEEPFPPPLGDLRGFDLMTSALWDAPINPRSEIVADVAHCPSGQVIVVDSTKAANGLRVYENAVEQTTAALPIGLGSFSSHGLVCY